MKRSLVTLALVASAFLAGTTVNDTDPAPTQVHVNTCDSQGQPVGDFRTCLDRDSKGLPFVTDGTHRLYVRSGS